MIVEGLVQGVGFRWFVMHHAHSMGLNGFVRNLYNGDVEIEAEGPRASLEDLVRQVRIGPRSSHVTSVHVDWRQPTFLFKGFEVR